MEKAHEYIKQAAQNQREAAKVLDDQLSAVNNHFDEVLKSTPLEYQNTMINTINRAKTILSNLKQNGDVQSAVNALNALKNGC